MPHSHSTCRSPTKAHTNGRYPPGLPTGRAILRMNVPTIVRCDRIAKGVFATELSRVISKSDYTTENSGLASVLTNTLPAEGVLRVNETWGLARSGLAKVTTGEQVRIADEKITVRTQVKIPQEVQFFTHMAAR